MTDATKRAEHTPGPWKLRRVAGGVWAIGISRGPHVGLGRDVAVCRGEGARANARLIAAAPELLEASKGLEQAVWDEFGPVADNVHDAAERVREVIAEIEGEHDA